jgi:4-hydroxyphenylpyruvate dioxygenase
METLELEKPPVTDFLPLNGTDYIELYVGNARQSAHYYQTAFGFQPVAHAGLATGLRDRESYVVQQGKIRLVLTSPLHDNTEMGRHIDQQPARTTRMAT